MVMWECDCLSEGNIEFEFNEFEILDLANF